MWARSFIVAPTLGSPSLTDSRSPTVAHGVLNGCVLIGDMGGACAGGARLSTRAAREAHPFLAWTGDSLLYTTCAAAVGLVIQLEGGRSRHWEVEGYDGIGIVEGCDEIPWGWRKRLGGQEENARDRGGGRKRDVMDTTNVSSS